MDIALSIKAKLRKNKKNILSATINAEGRQPKEDMTDDGIKHVKFI